MKTDQQFSKLRSIFWPIHSHEVSKFLPMCGMMFFILFNYTILRNSKDALVVSAGGASVIPFIKGYVVLPASILFVFIYSKLLDKFSRTTVFNSIITFFMVFYAIFAFVLYPMKGILHPSAEWVQAASATVPNLKHFISIYANWSYSVYYVLAEIWGSAALSLLFWQFANDITKTHEAKRFYAMFGLMANFSLILAGTCGKLFYTMSKEMSNGGDSWGIALNMISASVIISCLFVLYFYRDLNRKLRAEGVDLNKVEPKKGGKKKAKVSVTEGLKIVFKNPYIRKIALLVFCYGVSINLIELLWKNQMKMAFPNPNDYNNFMGNLSIGTGIFTIITILTFKGILQKFGWLYGAIATPLVILVTGTLFFGCLYFGEIMSPIAAGLGVSTLVLGVWIGTVQNILSKGIKYGLFDPTKEMTYIPLSADEKTKGKAAVDVVGARFGKASGGYIASVLLMITAGTVNDISSYMSIAVIAIIALWIYSVVSLSGLYQDKLNEKAAAEELKNTKNPEIDVAKNTSTNNSNSSQSAR